MGDKANERHVRFDQPSSPLTSIADTASEDEEMFSDAMAIPSGYLAENLPSNDLAIVDFITTPRWKEKNSRASISTFFSQLCPTKHTFVLRDLLMPDASLLSKLTCALPSWYQKGIRSLIWEGTDCLLPLWVIPLWGKIAETDKHKQKWDSARRWIHGVMLYNGSVELTDIAHATQLILNQLGWNTFMWKGEISLHSLELAELFKNGPIVDNLMTAAMRLVAARIAGCDRPELHGICLCDWALHLQFRVPEHTWHDYEATSDVGDLRALGKRIQDKSIRRVFFPVHILELEHWVMYQIDFSHHLIFYGDSLDHMDPLKKMVDIDRVQSWITRLGFEEFEI